MTRTKVRPQHPLFERWDISAIARRTGYREVYLIQLREGYIPLSKLFRHKVAAIFHKLESELFLDEDPQNGGMV